MIMRIIGLLIRRSRVRTPPLPFRGYAGKTPSRVAGEDADNVSRSPRFTPRLMGVDWYGVALMSAAVLPVAALAFITLRTDNAHAEVEHHSTHGVGTSHTPTPCSSSHTTPYQAIDCIWPRQLRAKARRVAECESTASASERIARNRHLGRWARDYANGTHWGVFQLGPRERRDHGRYQLGSPAMVQVASAYDLYSDRGWSPWEWSRHCWGRS